MKNFLWALLKISIGFMIFALITAIVFYVVVIHFQQSYWVAFLILGILLAITLVSVLVLRYLKRFRQKKFVEHIIAQDDLLAQKAKNEEYSRLQDLREKWNAAISFLKDSHVGKNGNPIYQLPWYLIIGETDAGKSSSIAKSGLHSVNSAAGPIPGVTSTRNCDWWFLDNAVIIDSAGKYAVPVDGKIDEVEWQEFLVQISATRQKEPVNGILVALPMEKLLAHDEDTLYAYAGFISDRVNRLVKVLGARIPIYVLLTKCDLLAGFHQLANILSNEELEQAFGYTSNSTSESHSMIVEQMIDSVIRSIHQIIYTKHIDNDQNVANGLLVFIQNISLLKEKINKFITLSFDNNTYHEEVLLRGIYLSSAFQKGTQTSLYKSDIVSGTYTVDRNKSMFLKNIFKEIMPHDRGLYQPILELLRWRSTSANLLVLVVALVSLCYIGYIAYGTSYNDHVSDDDLGATIVSAISSETTNQMIYDYTDMLKKVHLARSSYSYRLQLPFTKKNLNEAIKTSKAFFVKDFEQEIFNKIISTHFWDRLIADSLDENEPLGDAIYFYATMLKYLDGCRVGDCNKEKKLLKQLEIINLEKLYINKTNSKNFVYLLEKYIKYKFVDRIGRDHDALDPLYDTVLNAFNYYLEKHQSTKWLLGWANAKTNSIDVETFWPLLHVDHLNSSVIDGAYTKDGYALIEKMFNALPTEHKKINMEKLRSIFMNYYFTNYVSKWVNFGSDFYKASIHAPLKEKLSILHLMFDVDQNPFFAIQKLTYDQLSFISQYKSIDLSKLKLSQISINSYKTTNKNNKVKQVIKKGERQLNTIMKAIDDNNNVDYLDQVETVVDNIGKFFDAGKNTIRNYNSNNLIKKRLANDFRGDLDSDDKYYDLIKSANELEPFLEVDQNKSYALSQPSGYVPYDSTLQYLNILASDMIACQLQESWISKVYRKFMTNSDVMGNALYGENGLISKYLSEEAEPFIQLTETSYKEFVRGDFKINFTNNFINYLTMGETKATALNLKSAKITLTSLPLEVNEDARINPNGAILTLICESGDKVLENYNYNASLVYDWKPNDCSSVKIDILFDGFKLTKEYDGDYAFSDFLTQYTHAGGVKLLSNEFPSQKQMLNAYGIDWISLSYRLKGAEKVREYYNALQNPNGIPYQITECNQ